MLSADDVIERLCNLQAEVQAAFCHNTAADCFCGKDGFWGSEGYGGTLEEGYRNEGKALEFIEQAVRKELNNLSGHSATHSAKH